MPRRTGFGIFYDYHEIPDDKKVLSPDGKKAVAFWVRRERSDRFDDDTSYAIAVWDSVSGELLESYTEVHNVSHQTGAVLGKPVRAVCFDETGERVLVEYADGSARKAGLEPDSVPPWERRRKRGEPDLTSETCGNTLSRCLREPNAEGNHRHP